MAISWIVAALISSPRLFGMRDEYFENEFLNKYEGKNSSNMEIGTGIEKSKNNQSRYVSKTEQISKNNIEDFKNNLIIQPKFFQKHRMKKSNCDKRLKYINIKKIENNFRSKIKKNRKKSSKKNKREVKTPSHFNDLFNEIYDHFNLDEHKNYKPQSLMKKHNSDKNENYNRTNIFSPGISKDKVTSLGKYVKSLHESSSKNSKTSLNFYFKTFNKSIETKKTGLNIKSNKTKTTKIHQCSISKDFGYTIFSTFGAFYVPLIVMIIIYISIYRAAKNRIRRHNFNLDSKQKDKSEKMSKNDKKNKNKFFREEESSFMAESKDFNRSQDLSSINSAVNSLKPNKKKVIILKNLLFPSNNSTQRIKLTSRIQEYNKFSEFTKNKKPIPRESKKLVKPKSKSKCKYASVDHGRFLPSHTLNQKYQKFRGNNVICEDSIKLGTNDLESNKSSKTLSSDNIVDGNISSRVDNERLNQGNKNNYCLVNDKIQKHKNKFKSKSFKTKHPNTPKNDSTHQQDNVKNKSYNNVNTQDAFQHEKCELSKFFTSCKEKMFDNVNILHNASQSRIINGDKEPFSSIHLSISEHDFNKINKYSTKNTISNESNNLNTENFTKEAIYLSFRPGALRNTKKFIGKPFSSICIIQDDDQYISTMLKNEKHITKDIDYLNLASIEEYKVLKKNFWLSSTEISQLKNKFGLFGEKEHDERNKFEIKDKKENEVEREVYEQVSQANACAKYLPCAIYPDTTVNFANIESKSIDWKHNNGNKVEIESHSYGNKKMENNTKINFFKRKKLHRSGLDKEHHDKGKHDFFDSLVDSVKNNKNYDNKKEIKNSGQLRKLKKKFSFEICKKKRKIFSQRSFNIETNIFKKSKKSGSLIDVKFMQMDLKKPQKNKSQLYLIENFDTKNHFKSLSSLPTSIFSSSNLAKHMVTAKSLPVMPLKSLVEKQNLVANETSPASKIANSFIYIDLFAKSAIITDENDLNAYNKSANFLRFEINPKSICIISKPNDVSSQTFESSIRERLRNKQNLTRSIVRSNFIEPIAIKERSEATQSLSCIELNVDKKLLYDSKIDKEKILKNEVQNNALFHPTNNQINNATIEKKFAEEEINSNNSASKSNLLSIKPDTGLKVFSSLSNSKSMSAISGNAPKIKSSSPIFSFFNQSKTAKTIKTNQSKAAVSSTNAFQGLRLTPKSTLSKPFFQLSLQSIAVNKTVKSAEERAREKRETKRERKAARTLAIITGTFVVCWLPFFILALLRPFCPVACYTPPIISSLASWLGYLNSLINPVIYTIFNPDFR